MELVTPGIGLIFWTTLTFLIVFFVLAKYAWKPILSAIREREISIEEALNSAENAKVEMTKLKAENELLIQQAKLERDKILKDAQTAASNVLAEAKQKAVDETSKIIETARIAINTEKNAAMAEVKNQVATLSVQVAEKLLKRELASESAQKELVSDYIQEIKLN